VDPLAAAAFRAANPEFADPAFRMHVFEERPKGGPTPPPGMMGPEAGLIVYHMAVLGGATPQMRNQVCFRQLLVSERNGVRGEWYFMYTRIGGLDARGVSAAEDGRDSSRLAAAAQLGQLKKIWNERFHERTGLRWLDVGKDRLTFNAPNMTLLPLPPRT
jgi:hypothetical protein